MANILQFERRANHRPHQAQRAVGLLRDLSYLSTLRVVRENSTSLVHIAEIATPERGTQQAFVKAFPMRYESVGLTNELAGYLVARAVGLPVATNAYVLIVKTEKLFGVHPSFQAELSNTRGYNLAWCTSAIEGAPVRLLHKITDDEMRKRLRAWKRLPAVLAFDDWVANGDRSRDNLIAIRNNEFALVDHAEIAGGLSRLDGTIDNCIQVPNRLLKDVYGDQIPASVKSAMMLAAEQHSVAFAIVQPELDYWFKELFSNSTEDTTIIDFLRDRANTSVPRVLTQTGLLI